jgi:gamma-glutamyltranspeptidase/glutathione hydrolase
MKLAFADVYRYVADADMEVTPRRCSTTPTWPRAKLIDRAARRTSAPATRSGGTIYLTAADESGMMVSFIQSNYMGFGSGVVVPATASACRTAATASAWRRPAPTWWRRASGLPHHHPGLPDQGRPAVMSFGVMGGNMQPQGHQTLVRMLDYRQQPQAACDAPRWRFNQGLSINVEATMPAATRRPARAGPSGGVIHDSYQDFGAGQFIWRLGDPAVQGYVAASDPRRDGLAAAF